MDDEASPAAEAVESAASANSGAITMHPKPTGLMARSVWYARVYGHRLRAAARSAQWWMQNAVFFGVWAMIGWPLYEAEHATRGVLYTIGVIIMKIGLARRMSWSHAMQLVPRFYLERKTLLFRLVLEGRRAAAMNSHEIIRYQQDALALIANYVRSHREDPAGSEIFANLLVADGDEVVVVARSDSHRQPFARYPRKDTLVGRAIDQGEVGYTGDLERDWQAAGRSYKSVLVLPIRSETAVLGAVSIDSARSHHFDIEHSHLERALAPYIALLVWTLEQDRPKLVLAAASARGANGGLP